MNPAESMAGEEWRPVVGLEDGFLVSDHGRVYSIGRRRIMRPDPTSKYPRDGMHERQERNYLGLIGATGLFTRDQRRTLESKYAAQTRAAIVADGN